VKFIAKQGAFMPVWSWSCCACISHTSLTQGNHNEMHKSAINLNGTILVDYALFKYPFQTLEN